MFHNTNKKITEQKKFCKVCKDAGKTEEEYSSHYVRASREQSSKVVCPTLLNLECRYCHKKGHMPSRCEVLKEKKRHESRMKYETEHKNNATPKRSTFQANNSFADLESESDEEEEVYMFCPPASGISYASIASKPAAAKPVVVKEVPKAEPVNNRQVAFSEEDEYEVYVQPEPRAKRTGKLDWTAELSSSDEDEDYEDERTDCW